MAELPSLESRVQDTSEVAAAVQAALEGSVISLPLTEPPSLPGPHHLSLYLRKSSRKIVFVAAVAGSPSNGRFPLRLGPSDAAPRASLEAFIEDVRKKEREAAGGAPKPVAAKVESAAGAKPAAAPAARPPSLAPVAKLPPAAAPPQSMPDGTPLGFSKTRANADAPPAPAPAAKPRPALPLMIPVPKNIPAAPPSPAPRPAPPPAPAPVAAPPVQRPSGVLARPKTAGVEGRTLGRYRVLSALRDGGVRVYRAEQVGIGKSVAITILRPLPSRQIHVFQREATAAIEIDHKNVAKTLDFGQEDDGLLYIAAELAPGMDLRTVLRDRPILPLPRIVSLMSQVCAALGAAHERGVSHGHVTPEKLLLSPARDDEGNMTEQVKLCGFGMPSERSEESRRYHTPERIRGAAADPSADVYACGVLLYEIATGVHPFGPGDATTRAPRPPSTHNPGIDPGLEAVIVSAMHDEQLARYESARALRSALRSLTGGPTASGEVVTGRRMSESPPSKPPPKGVVVMADFKIPMSAQAALRQDALEVDFTRTEEESSAPEGLEDIRHQPPWVALEVITNSLVTDPVKVLDPLDSIKPLARFAAELKRHVKPVATLGHRGETVALWTAICWLAQRARGAAPSPDTREGVASQAIIDVLADPETLSPVGRVAIEATGLKSEAARRILNGAGSLGATALLDARERGAQSKPIAASREDRPRFITALAEVGLPGVPAIVTFVKQRDTLAPWFVEEILDGMAAYPPVTGDMPGSTVTSGKIDVRAVAGAEIAVALFGRSPPGVRRACAAAIAGLLGRHGNPQLAAILKQDEHDGPRIAAIEALRKTGGIDREVIFELDAILAPNTGASLPLRMAAASALVDAPAPVRPQAAGLLARALKPPSGGLLTKLVGGDEEEPQLLVTMARTLLTIGGGEAVGVIEARANRATPDLKRQLLALVTSHSRSGS